MAKNVSHYVYDYKKRKEITKAKVQDDSFYYCTELVHAIEL